MIGVGKLRWKCYRHHQQNPLPCPDSMVLVGQKKKEYTKPHTYGRGVSYGKIGLTTVAVTHDLLSGMPLVLLRKELIRLWSSILPEPGQPSAQLSKLICLTSCKKTKHIVSRWYRTVYIPWLVASYDTHKGKRWLNSKPPKPHATNSVPTGNTAFFISLSCSIPTIVFDYFSLSLLPVYRLVLWGCGLQTDRLYITLSQPYTANLFL